MPPQLAPTDALLIVDVQNDFCPGGLLPVPDGEQIIPVLNRWIEACTKAGVPVFASQDWHTPHHSSFQEKSGPWPQHCVQDTPGAALHPGLTLPSDAVIVRKGSHPQRDAYSAFDGTDLASRLQAAGVRRLWVGGLALDYCVRFSVLDACKIPGLEVHLLMDATRGVDIPPGEAQRALEEMRAAGAKIEEAVRR